WAGAFARWRSHPSPRCFRSPLRFPDPSIIVPTRTVASGRRGWGFAGGETMNALRTVGVVALVLAAAGSLRAESHELVEAVQAGDCCHIRLDMKLTGKLHLQKEDKTVPLKLEAIAAHE